MDFFTFSKKTNFIHASSSAKFDYDCDVFSTIEIPIKILAASICMIGSFCKNMAASNFFDGKKSTQNVIK